MAFDPDDLPHPRDTFSLEGVEAADAAFIEALDRGRLHHAWLLTGPEGAGKASFAYRAARRLLGARPDPTYGALGSAPHDVVSQQVSARSHPDLMVLERIGEDGKPRKVIPVDEARKLSEFFSKSPGSAPYRVAIIDAADDLNVNSANAVLKTLEEPPERGVLFLISHAPGSLLPTIRSRCRRLAIPPLDEARAAERTAAIAGVSDEDAAALAHMARGAVGRALRLAAAGAIEADREAREILRSLPASDPAALLALADSFRGGEGMARFTLLFERLADQVHDMAMRDAAEGRNDGLDRWAEVWALLRRMPIEAEALNLDRADSLFTAVRELRRAAS